jgi:hypothetical protein
VERRPLDALEPGRPFVGRPVRRGGPAHLGRLGDVVVDERLPRLRRTRHRGQDGAARVAFGDLREVWGQRVVSDDSHGVRLPFDDLRGHAVRLQDRTSPAVSDRSGDDLLARGLYLDMPGWAYHVFVFQP